MTPDITPELVVMAALVAGNLVFTVRRPQRFVRWMGKKIRQAGVFVRSNLDAAHARQAAIYFVALVVLIARYDFLSPISA